MVATLETIPLNSSMKFTVSFFDSSNAPTDPDVIQITVNDPNQNSTTYTYPATLSKEKTGVYSVTLVGNVEGDWVGRGRGILSDGTTITTLDVVQPVAGTSVI